VEVVASGHVKYPGGKQSASRTVRNFECVLVCDRSGPRGRSGVAAADLLALRRLELLLAAAYDPDRVRAGFRTDGDVLTVPGGPAGEVKLRMPDLIRFAPEARDAAALPPAARAALAELLPRCALRGPGGGGPRAAGCRVQGRVQDRARGRGATGSAPP